MNDFVRKGHEGVKFFVGPEIEQTPAFGKKTLFVVDLQDTDVVEKLARAHKTPHIFVSANRSFDDLELVNGTYIVTSADGAQTAASAWEAQIHALLDKGFMVSLDYPAHKHAMVLKVLNAGIWQSRNFIPLLSVAVPHVSTSSKNLTIKIDDINFRATNPGVWCMHHTEVTDSNRFTDWNEYTGDEIISEEEIAKYAKPITTLPLKVPGSDPAFREFIANKKAAELATEVNPIGTGAPEEVAVRKVFSVEVEGAVTPEQVQAVANAIKNDTSLGLDPDGPSKLKPDTTIVVDTPAVDAVAAYAEGAKSDPLGKEESAKPGKAKKK